MYGCLGTVSRYPCFTFGRFAVNLDWQIVLASAHIHSNHRVFNYNWETFLLVKNIIYTRLHAHFQCAKAKKCSYF